MKNENPEHLSPLGPTLLNFQGLKVGFSCYEDILGNGGRLLRDIYFEVVAVVVVPRARLSAYLPSCQSIHIIIPAQGKNERMCNHGFARRARRGGCGARFEEVARYYILHILLSLLLLRARTGVPRPVVRRAAHQDDARQNTSRRDVSVPACPEPRIRENKINSVKYSEEVTRFLSGLATSLYIKLLNCANVIFKNVRLGEEGGKETNYNKGSTEKDERDESFSTEINMVTVNYQNTSTELYDYLQKTEFNNSIALLEGSSVCSGNNGYYQLYKKRALKAAPARDTQAVYYSSGHRINVDHFYQKKISFNSNFNTERRFARASHAYRFGQWH
ncbi:unnamed protein product, partial [Trichogramma brassicae]